MTFPHAAAGIKKVVTATVLDLIGNLGLALAGILGVGAVSLVAAAGADGGAKTAAEIIGVGAILLVIASVILPFIGMILHILGLREASKDGGAYLQSALVFAVANLVAIVLNAIVPYFTDYKLYVYLPQLVMRIAELGTYVYTIHGIAMLAVELGNPDVEALGARCINVLMVSMIASMVLSAALSLVGSYVQLPDSVKNVLSVASIALSVVSVSVYLIFLRRGRTMLQTS